MPTAKSLRIFDKSLSLKNSEISGNSQEQAAKGSHEAVLPEILNVLKAVCDLHNLPLAQTWAPCFQQGKGGCWHADKNALCVSTVDSACYVRDGRVLNFHMACSEYHLLRGQGGIVGKAFETNQPCFATDVDKCDKIDHPLSHHAKMFGLHAAVAIQLCSIYKASKDYVLEFYLPSDVQQTGLTFHGRIWQSISIVIQQHCRSLQFITVKGLQRQILCPGKLSVENKGKVDFSTSQKNQQEENFWFSDMMDLKRKDKEVVVPLEFGDEEPSKKFKLTTQWSKSGPESQLGQVISDKQDSGSKSTVEATCGSTSLGKLPLDTGGKRRTKAQKTIGLQVLRQYFAGSMKDAARSIGVCPTTLKRICRQHGISRWPSRKIKKVDHSLRKLQLVIDSVQVQGARGALKLFSFYSNFPALNTTPNTQQMKGQLFSTNLNDQQKQQLAAETEGNIFCSGATTSNSPSISSSHTCTSRHHFSSGAKISSPVTNIASGSKDASAAGDPGGPLKRGRSEAGLWAVLNTRERNQLLERSQSNKCLADHPSVETRPHLTIMKNWPVGEVGAFKAKATFKEEKVRLTILLNRGLQALRQELAKRFDLEDLSKIGIKYLDDDKEWVLLTCDDDLKECVDIHKSCGRHTIKLAVSTAASCGGSVGSSSLS